MGRTCFPEQVDKEEAFSPHTWLLECGETVAKRGSHGQSSWLGVRHSQYWQD